jgi:hypothetical protein
VFHVERLWKRTGKPEIFSWAVQSGKGVGNKCRFFGPSALREIRGSFVSLGMTAESWELRDKVGWSSIIDLPSAKDSRDRADRSEASCDLGIPTSVYRSLTVVFRVT